MFKKKEKPVKEPFVPRYYVLALYRDGLKFRTRTFDTEEQARRMRDEIMAGADSQEWVEIDGDIIRSNHVEALTIERTHPPISLGWG
jgi:hypothetical protein